MNSFKVGTNQHKKKRRVTVGGAGAASLFILLFLHLLFNAEVAMSNHIINKYSPKPEIVSPMPSKGSMFVETAYAEAAPREIKQFKNERVEKVWDYLFSNGSPFVDEAEFIVDMADGHDIPWTLVVAIAGKESSFGKNIQEGSYNAWGVMEWDSNGDRHIKRFSSWHEAIHYETILLSNHYRENMNKAIQEKYCPSIECSDTWVGDVTGFQEEINK